MKIHSEILVHWTLKELVNRESTEDVCRIYIKRLQDFYKTGIRFNIPDDPPDIVIGVGHRTELPRRPMISFTELRLSEVDMHMKKYGRLGIGFRRDFLMTWGANPVFYLQSKDQGIVNTNLKIMPKLIERLKSNIEDIPAAKALEVFLTYFKPMDKPDGEPFDNYDEMEWRIVDVKYDDKERPDRFKVYGNEVGFTFLPQDVLLLVFPDEHIRKAVLADSELKKRFEEHMPMMVNANECTSF